MQRKKRIALVAHDLRKQDLLRWTQTNADQLAGHTLFGTGTTGKLLSDNTKLNVKRLKSGPLGGDMQLGAMISELKLDILIFFWDPMTAQPHDVDIKALLRMSVLYNVVLACNHASADFIISSPLFETGYVNKVKDYSELLP